MVDGARALGEGGEDVLAAEVGEIGEQLIGAAARWRRAYLSPKIHLLDAFLVTPYL